MLVKNKHHDLHSGLTSRLSILFHYCMSILVPTPQFSVIKTLQYVMKLESTNSSVLLFSKLFCLSFMIHRNFKISFQCLTQKVCWDLYRISLSLQINFGRTAILMILRLLFIKCLRIYLYLLSFHNNVQLSVQILHICC